MTNEDLKTMQAWDLDRKIMVTQARLIEWYNHYEGKVYVSFSGGKDSTVLLDIARQIFPEIEAVFIDTGLEYPEIREFVKTIENVTILRPEMRFDQVVKKYGYPALSKTISHNVSVAKRNPDGNVMKNVFNPEKKGPYAMYKWSFMFDADFEISEKCCDVMKKKPGFKFQKETGKKVILGTMTEESRMRKDKWLQLGCNVFEKNQEKSKPMSFWTEQDVLLYLKTYKTPYCSIYGDIIEEKGKLKTTGEKRTGCIFCMFGAHLEKSPNRFERLKQTHPKIHDYCIKPLEDGGLGLGKVLDYINIKY